jgi:hypothetical protein
MMNLTLEVFRQQVQERRGERRRGASRYPEDLVAFAVKHARAAQASGRSLHAAAGELGLSSMTLDKWLSRAGRSTGQRLREVVVRDATVEAAPDARTVEVKTVSGHIVRGLSVADAAALLRALT